MAGVAAFLLQLGAARPSTQQSSASIKGVVIDASTHQPIAEAKVTLSGNRTVIQNTDSAGKFSFSGVARGTYVLGVSKPHYLQAHYGSGVPDRRWFFELEEAEGRTDIAIPLWRWSGISGRVVDADGKPLAGQDVIAWYRLHRAGVEWFNLVQIAKTDADGNYRLPLISGTYVVIAGSNLAFTTPAGPESRPSPTRPAFFPSTFDADLAGRIELAPATELTRVDFELSPTSTVSIIGRLTKATELPPKYRLDLVLTPACCEYMESEVTARRAQPTVDGMVRFDGVTPGRYLLTSAIGSTAEIHVGGADGAFVSSPSVRQELLAADRDGKVEIVPRAPLVLRGSVSIPPGGPWGAISVRISSPIAGRLRSVSPDKDGAFEIRGVPPGEYILDAKVAGNSLILHSVVVSGVDATDRPFTLHESTDARIVLTDKSARLIGSVQGSSVELLNTNVLVFPSDPSLWTRWGEESRKMRGVRLRAGARYEVGNLPQGDYWVVAVLDDVYAYPYRWQHPDYLRALIARATRAFVQEGTTKSVDLKVGAR